MGSLLHPLAAGGGMKGEMLALGHVSGILQLTCPLLLGPERLGRILPLNFLYETRIRKSFQPPCFCLSLFPLLAHFVCLLCF